MSQTHDAHSSVSKPLADDGLRGRLAFLGLGDEDAQRLRALAPRLATSGDAFVDAFYEHLLAFPATAHFLQNPAVVERIRKLQLDHLNTMLQAQWSGDYVRRRNQVGQTHAELGVEPAFFLAAYSRYVEHFLTRARQDYKLSAKELSATLSSLLKAIFLDVGLTLDAYFGQLTLEMRKALEMYWRANNELRQFAELASHDLRTPLATVANLCDEALDEFGGEMPAGAVELIQKARDRLFRMSAMMNELLAAVVSTGEAVDSDIVDARELVQEAIEQARGEIDGKDIRIVVAEGLPRLTGSKARLREAFYNLVSNAAKFIDHAQGRIEVGFEWRGDELVFFVRDNGPGFSPEDAERLFAPFRRLAMHRESPGFGLGLYFTKNMVEKEGGRIWAESRPGQGSCFYIGLPKSAAAGAPAMGTEPEA